MPPSIFESYAAVRARTQALIEGLSEADCQVQSMPDASPLKWHLAHTTWFFETFVLERFAVGFKPFDPAFRVLFNSYYQGVGEQYPRTQRGLVTRPGLREVLAYRAAVDERMAEQLAGRAQPGLEALVTLGLQHEQQHQELMLTDLLHLLSCNPLAPVYRPRPQREATDPGPAPRGGWHRLEGGLVEIGHGGSAFAFDNETPRHRQWLAPYALARRCVSRGEWAAFMADGGYRDHRWWSAAGWDWVRREGIAAPLHERGDGRAFTLHGLLELPADTPATHLSWYEADAFARWWSAQHPGMAPVRLPTEGEWEHAAQSLDGEALAGGQFAEDGVLHARPTEALFGSVWQWTASPYTPYPGFRAWEGAVGEYNAKFMVNQMVLRGGSLATPRSHLRASYRNFFPAEARWQFSGLRLAQDLG
jgi:ergothioneine biosynthesis protein EgtB